MARLPRDANSSPLPGFAYLSTPQRQNLTAGVTSSNATIPTGSAGKFVVVRVSCAIWLNFGTSGVTAAANTGSMLWPGGELIVKVPSSATHVAVLRVGAADCAVQLELLSDEQKDE